MTYTLTLNASPNPILISGSSTLTATCSTIPNQYQFFKEGSLIQTNSISLSSPTNLTNSSYTQYFLAVASDVSGNLYTIYKDVSNQTFFYKFDPTFTTVLITISSITATNLAVDSSDRIYLVSNSDKWIRRYDNTGTTLQLQINTTYSPSFIEVDQNNNIYVSSYNTSYIYVYDPFGIQLFSISLQNISGYGVRGIAVDTNLPYPNIYFSSLKNTTSNKNYAGRIGYDGLNNSYSISYVILQNYANPQSVQMLNNDNFLVLDDNGFNIYQYQTSDGALINKYYTDDYFICMNYNKTLNKMYKTKYQSNIIQSNSFLITNTQSVTSYGSYSVTANFGNSYTLSASITVLYNSYTITWGPLTPLTYGDPLPASYLNATSSISGTFSYNVSVGQILPANETTGNELIATFTPTNTNIYAPTNTSNFLIVDKYTPSISWPSLQPINTTTPLTNQNELNAVATDYLDNVLNGTYVYKDTTTSTFIQAGDFLPYGSNDLSVLFTPTDTSNYNTKTDTNQISVENLKQVVTITWNVPSAISYGTPLSSTQLNATATATDSFSNPVAGTFTYTPTYGTILNVGNKLLSCLFTPTNTSTYYSRSSITDIIVNTIDVSVYWTRPYDIYYYTPLSLTEYDASFLGYNGSPISGTSTYNPAIGTTLSNGYHTLQITFDPTSSNYNTKVTTQQIYSLGPIAYSPLEPTIPIDQKSVSITFSGGIKYTFVPDRWNKKVNDQTYIFSPPFPINFLVIAESPTGLQLETIFPVYKKLSEVEKIDAGIIPFAIAIEVFDRKREFLWNYFKENPTLVKQLSNFFYQSLFVNYNDATKGKDGSCAKVPWRTEYEYIKAKDVMILSSKQQYELLRYVYQQQKKGLQTNSNYGYLMFLLGDFMKNLQQAMNAYKTKQENLVCYYHLGKNINSPEELYKFLLQYTY